MTSKKSKALVSVAVVYPAPVGCLLFHEYMARYMVALLYIQNFRTGLSVYRK